jgi:hypothetical protein
MFSSDFATILICLMHSYAACNAAFKDALTASPRTLGGTGGKWMALLLASGLLFDSTGRRGIGDKEAPSA